MVDSGFGGGAPRGSCPSFLASASYSPLLALSFSRRSALALIRASLSIFCSDALGMIFFPGCQNEFKISYLR